MLKKIVEEYVKTARPVGSKSLCKKFKCSSATIRNDTYYANYSGNVTNYYYSSSYTNRTLYRNEFFTSNTAMGARLSTTNNDVVNYTTEVGPGSSAWSGLSTAKDTTAEYTSVQDAANTSDTSLYTVYQFNVAYAKGSNVSSIGSTSGSCKVTTSSTSCNVTLPTITPNTGYEVVGWSTTIDDTTGVGVGSMYPVSLNNQTLYGNSVAGQFTVTFGKNFNNIMNMPADGAVLGAGAQVIYTWTNTTGSEAIITEVSSDVDVCSVANWDKYYQPKVTLRIDGEDVHTIQEEMSNYNYNSDGIHTGLNIRVPAGSIVEMYSYGYTAGGQDATFWYGSANQCHFKYKIDDSSTIVKAWTVDDTNPIGKVYGDIDGHAILRYDTAAAGNGTSYATTITPKEIFNIYHGNTTLYSIWN